MSSSIYKKVGFASLIMMGSVFLSRIFGILREIVIAYLAGTDGSVDAYQVSFIIPEILNHILASGFLSITFIPIFTSYLKADRENEAWEVFSNIINSFGLLLIIFIVFTLFLAEHFISLTGLENREIYLEAVRMTRIIIPAQFFFFAGGILMAVQFAKEKFLIPALAPLIYNLSIILGGLILYPLVGMAGFSWGVLIGAFIGNFAIQWFGAKRVGLKWSPIVKPRHPEFKKYLLLTLPLMLGLTMTFSTEIFPKLFGSYLPPGSVASLNYGLRVMFLLVGLLGQAVGVASYPYLSSLAVQNRMEELNDLLNRTLKLISLVIPCSVLVVVLRKEIVFLLFERGQFDASSTLVTSTILVYLMAGAFAFTAQTIVTRGFYAMQNTLFPTIFISLAVIITLPLYYIGMMKLGVYGIALALSLSTIFQVILLFALWNRKNANSKGGSVYLFYLKMMLISVLIGLILTGFKQWAFLSIPSSTIQGSLIHLVSISILFAALLLGAGYFFKIQEIFVFSNRLLKR
jgi:putative peptidoglycan lipid II flippase